jgi:hypothetical protein
MLYANASCPLEGFPASDARTVVGREGGGLGRSTATTMCEGWRRGGAFGGEVRQHPRLVLAQYFNTCADPVGRIGCGSPRRICAHWSWMNMYADTHRCTVHVAVLWCL